MPTTPPPSQIPSRLLTLRPTRPRIYYPGSTSQPLQPVAPLALRTSGHLLLGVVRIHDGKQKSLMHDCSDALVKIKLAFRPGNVDLPADRVSVNYNSITQGPEDLDADFADEFPAVEDDR